MHAGAPVTASDTDAFPIPCRRCGASMEVQAASSVLEAPLARCRYCGSEEPLAREPAERVRALRLRLAQLRFGEQLEEAPAIAMARALTTWKQTSLPTIGAIGALLVVVSGINVTSLLTSGSASPATVVQAAFVPVGGLLLLGVLTLGSLWSMHAYAVELRPALEARPPLADGAPMRCRGCGGEIESRGTEGIVPCSWCGASNVVSAAIARDRAARLEAETQQYARRLAGHRVRLDEATRRYTRRLYVAMALGAALSIVATLGVSILGMLLPRWLLP